MDHEGNRIERRSTDYLADRLAAIEVRVDEMPAVVEQTMRRVLSDEAFVKQIGEKLFTQASDGASKWIGARILRTFIVAVAAAAILWLAKTGDNPLK